MPSRDGMTADKWIQIARKRAEALREMITAMEGMLRAYEQLMPGIRYIAVKDYANLNEAPIRAREAIRKAEES